MKCSASKCSLFVVTLLLYVVIIRCYYTLLLYVVIIRCYYTLLLYVVIIRCYYTLLLYVVIIRCYFMLKCEILSHILKSSNEFATLKR